MAPSIPKLPELPPWNSCLARRAAARRRASCDKAGLECIFLRFSTSHSDRVWGLG